MPEEEVVERARRDKEEGKSPSTQAGEFVREEMHHVREGKHGARSPQQAIAIGLSKARRAGVNLAPPKQRASAKTRAQAARDSRKGRSGNHKRSAARSRATTKALRREGHSAASRASLSQHAHSAANRRGASSRQQSARKAVRTKGKEKMSAAARKATRTRKKKQPLKRKGSRFQREPCSEQSHCFDAHSTVRLSLRPAGQVSNQRNDKQSQEDVKNELGDAGSSHGDPAKAQHRSNQCDNKESESPPYHHSLQSLLSRQNENPLWALCSADGSKRLSLQVWYTAGTLNLFPRACNAQNEMIGTTALHGEPNAPRLLSNRWSSSRD